MLQRLARECFVFLPLAQVRQLVPRSCVRIKKSRAQIRTGPSLCLAEPGWKLPCEGKIGKGERVQMFETTKQIKGGFSLDKEFHQ